MSSQDGTSAEPEEEMAPKNNNAYRLRVTAGPAYDLQTHKVVPVNAAKTVIIDNDLMTLAVTVRIQKYKGLPHDSPSTSPYFEHSLHKYDQYSISLSFIPKQDINGDDLLWGNDFDRPIRDRLPPGFDYAFKIAKWWVDPGLEHDARSDKPWIFGPALSSWNVFRIGEKEEKAGVSYTERFGETIVEEGGEGSGAESRSGYSIPSDPAGRKKFFLTSSNREKFIFEKGREYQSDFGNPHLDFNDFALNLPGGFHLNVISYVDSKTHELRHTLKNRKTGDIYAVVLFSLLFGEELEAAEEEERKNEPPGTEMGKFHKSKGAEQKMEIEEAGDDDLD